MSAVGEAGATLHRRQAYQSLFVAVGVTLALHWIPWLHLLSWPLLLVSTLAHELGHGLTAVALGGDLDRLLLWPDGSGMAAYAGRFSRWTSAIIAAGGLLGPPIAAFVLLLAGRRSRPAHAALAVIGGVLLLAGTWWSGSLFTSAVCLTLAAALLLLAWRAPAWMSQIVCVFFAVQLALASFTRSDYLFTAEAATGAGTMPSDVAQIASALWLPYWLWGALIALATLLLLALGAWRFVRALV